MAWKGLTFKNSLEDSSILSLTKIIQDTKNKYFFDVEDVKKDEFIQEAIKSVKKGFFIYLVKNKLMYVIFKDHMFKFSKGYPELETAREYGKKMGISEKDMDFEHFLDCA